MTAARSTRRVRGTQRFQHAIVERLDAYRLLATAGDAPPFAKHPVAIHVDAEPARWGTIDAPRDWMTRAPARTVMQTIDNRFHEWAEFETSRGTYVVTNEPERLVLSADEAAGLLSASADWGDAAVPSEGVADNTAPTPDAHAPVTGPADRAGPRVAADPKARPLDPADLTADDRTHPAPGPRDVIGTDTRARITGTTAHPFNTVGYVSTTFPGVGNFRGTGFLVSPFVALTNAHNIYDSDAAVYSSGVTFTPGQRQDSAGGAITSPYASLPAQSFQTTQLFIDAGTGYTNAHIQVDYAALFFDRSWQTRGIGTFMPLAFDVTPGSVNTAGYPRSVQGESNSEAQWNTFGTYSTVSGRILVYDNDVTGGNSGGPAWEFFPANATRRVVALTSYESASSNGGPRLVGQNQNLIGSWMNHAPAIPSDRFESNNAFASPTALGVVGSRRENNLTIHAGGNDDYYTFTPRFSGTTAISTFFGDIDGDLDLQVLNSAGTVIGSSGGVTDSETINATLIGGQTYTVRVYGFGGATNPDYDLLIAGRAPYLDRFEANNSLPAATDFGNATSVSESGLTIHNNADGDFFRITAVGSGTLSANLSFTHAAGDVDMRLYDEAGTVVASSGGTGNAESINFAASAGSTYTLNVFGFNGAINEYAMTLTAPAPSPAPSVTASAFLYETAQQVSIDFDRDVSASLDAGDLLLASAGGTATPAAVAWDAAANRATWTFTNLVADGDWLATLPAGSVSAGGVPLSLAHVHAFAVLAGDANLDRSVTFADLVTVAQNYNQPGRAYTEGNFDYSPDGLVGFTDLVLLAQRYGSSLPLVAGTQAGDPPTPGAGKATDKATDKDKGRGLTELA